jgi:kinesin family protein 18/19
MGVLKVGNKNRSKENTSLNENSSRSHAIMQVQIDIKERGQGI